MGGYLKHKQAYKKSGTFGQKIFLWILSFNLLIYVQKEFHSYLIGFCVITYPKIEIIEWSIPFSFGIVKFFIFYR